MTIKNEDRCFACDGAGVIYPLEGPSPTEPCPMCNGTGQDLAAVRRIQLISALRESASKRSTVTLPKELRSEIKRLALPLI